jgi:hypothetical protein
MSRHLPCNLIFASTLKDIMPLALPANIRLCICDRKMFHISYPGLLVMKPFVTKKRVCFTGCRNLSSVTFTGKTLK